MIVDTSAAIAIILREAGCEDLTDRLLEEAEVGVGTPTLAECGLVLAGKSRLDWTTLIDEFKTRFGLEEISFSSSHWVVASRHTNGSGRGGIPRS